MSEELSFNRLKDENSSYLLQHKENPVHWWSYGPEALQKAKQENKPIFLSIGYSSCHWCHVMAHESFQDEKTAAFLNENYICIKVDREEFPDIDNYYQLACQFFTGGGGWPLSAFLLPDMSPYFVGTYFPKVSKTQGQATFMDVITELKRAYSQELEQVTSQAEEITAKIKEGVIPQEKVDFEGFFPSAASILNAIDEFKDKDNGGFGSAPKFPQFSFYEWAIEQMMEGIIPKEQGEHIIKSIEHMLMGGLYDHAKGGIHRYSVDEKWLVPHFEKMLYDQAGLLRLLAKTSVLFPSPLIFDGLIQTLEYLESEMLSEKHYFFSAQDADSEGMEGLFFTFSDEEFDDVINSASSEEENLEADREKIKDWFCIKKEGNFDQGLNVISLNTNLKSEIFSKENWPKVRKIRRELVEARKLRIPPATDNKGIASWNFMMVSSLVDVMQYCQVPVIRKMASELFNKLFEGLYSTFLLSNESSSTKIRHTTTKENSLCYFEDYVFFAEAQLRTFELTGNDVFKSNFKDAMTFIFGEFLEDDHLLTRAKSMNDHELYPNQMVTPYDQSFRSPLATFITLVRRGAVLFSEPDYIDRIEKLLERTKHEVLKNPLGAGEGLRAMTYPQEAFRKVMIPKEWLGKDEFLNFLGYFLPRFIFDFHEEGNDSWQICNLKECEVKGESLDEFIATLKPPKKEEK